MYISILYISTVYLALKTLDPPNISAQGSQVISQEWGCYFPLIDQWEEISYLLFYKNSSGPG